MKTNNNIVHWHSYSCLLFFLCVCVLLFFFSEGGGGVLVVCFVLSVLICHLTAGITSLSKILGLGQTPVELYMWWTKLCRLRSWKVQHLAQLKATGQHFCHFRRYDSFRHFSSVFKCRSLAFIADERLESVVERIWAIFNLYVLPFFVVVVVVFVFYHNALIAFRSSRVARFRYFLSSFKFSFVLSRLANFLAYFLFILSAFFQSRVI